MSFGDWMLTTATGPVAVPGSLGAARARHREGAPGDPCAAWGQPIQKLRRGWIAAAACFGFAVALASVAAGTQAARERSESIGIGFALVQVIIVALWWAASLALPHDQEAGWLALFPGALLVGLGGWVLHLASVFVLARWVASASDLYGSLGMAAALLLWLYLLGRLVVAAAMLNATLWERRTGSGQGRSPEPGHRLAGPGLAGTPGGRGDAG